MWPAVTDTPSEFAIKAFTNFWRPSLVEAHCSFGLKCILSSVSHLNE